MTISLTTLRSELRIHLGGLDETDLPNADADLLLNRALWEIMDKFKFREKEKSVSFVTTVGVRLYQAPSPFEALQQLSIEDLNDQTHKTIDPITYFTYENEYANRTDTQGKPEKYVREGDAIRLLPTPDAVYTVVMKYWTTLADLSDNNTNTNIPQVWDELVLFGGVWRGFLRLGDYQLGTSARQHQTALIETTTPVEEKEKADRHLAHLEVEGYDKQNL